MVASVCNFEPYQTHQKRESATIKLDLARTYMAIYYSTHCIIFAALLDQLKLLKTN